MTRKSIDLDEKLLGRGLRIFKCKSKGELVHLALTELLKSAKQREILNHLLHLSNRPSQEPGLVNAEVVYGSA